MYTDFIDGVKIELGEKHDFSWLGEYGKVFIVFDKQDSGNIAFGVEGKDGKLFIKYAGARNTEYDGSIEEAVSRLKKSAVVYDNIKHPNLIELVEHKEIGSGYACVFSWVQGECMNAHWNFDKFPKYTHPLSPNYKFSKLKEGEKLQCLRTILNVQKYISSLGYVAIDFYDGSIMYDFENQATTICDIDMFEKMPYINHMGKMWGSSRFMSPEEFTLGAEIDEITNVYTMGAMMFELLGSSTERNLASWTVGEKLFYVAQKAVSEKREDRYGSIGLLIKDFEGAVKN